MTHFLRPLRLHLIVYLLLSSSSTCLAQTKGLFFKGIATSVYWNAWKHFTSWIWSLNRNRLALGFTASRYAAVICGQAEINHFNISLTLRNPNIVHIFAHSLVCFLSSPHTQWAPYTRGTLKHLSSYLSHCLTIAFPVTALEFMRGVIKCTIYWLQRLPCEVVLMSSRA